MPGTVQFLSKPVPHSLKKSLRYTLRIAGGILGLFLLLYLAANVVIALKRETLSQMVISQINKQVIGIVTIGDLSPDYFRSFPNLSVCLTDVFITDSLRDIHHRDFLTAEKVRVRIQLLSLVKGKPKISRVIVEDSTIDLYTDECGYCNLNRRDDVGFKKGNSDIPGFTFKRSRIIIQNEFVNSYHDFDFEYLDCDVIKRDSVNELAINMKSLVHSIGFNMAKGSYLKEKTLDGDFSLLFYQGEKIQLANVELDIEDHPYLLNGNIFLNTEPK